MITAPLERPVSADGPCPSADPVVCRIRVMPMDGKVEAQRVRMRYRGLLEDMRSTEAAVREAGATDEGIARELVAMRNQAKYGNPLGVREPPRAHRRPALRQVRHLTAAGSRRLHAHQLRRRP
ncbi:hypothetical protein ACFQ8C_18100 [Streptomyces sp. NPDC056503]|uniref:hypothetical protein n=1 Tax=Streptomyces sp. NPDC056503 TaxID=3345842 RepID=UPI0036AE0A26